MTRGHVQVDRYRVERTLGEGGMGTVYQVLDATSGQHLALKRLRAQSNSAAHVELFEREYQTLASLRHPRIVRVLEYGVDEAGPFYTMELLTGSDLSRCAPLPWREACACLRDVASTLGVLHARRLVHRDLSPRNLWLTPDGRLKLLDFGALTPFGPTHEIVGTPAFIAPEMLAGKPLDQRTDLFALGALGYWLITGRHAFWASHVGELARAWKRPPEPLSRVAKVARPDDEATPAELERLLDALLRLDMDERPRNTAEVVDQLNEIGGLRPEHAESVASGYLESGAFVGREPELECFAQQLSALHEGKPQLLLVTGPEGCGRTRLLDELGLSARLRGHTVVSTSATPSGRPYQTVAALIAGLLKAAPSEAGAISHDVSSVFGSLSVELAKLLDHPPPPTAADNAASERVRKQTASVHWLLGLSRRRPLLLIVDDLQHCDEESHAVLATLARAPEGHNLLLLCAERTPDEQAEPQILKGLARARRMRLSPVSPEEARGMLRSIFGEVAYLERLAARLHSVASGSPGGILQLARHLVRTGDVRYSDGSWVLPSELPSDLPTSLDADRVAVLEELPADARRIARVASLAEHGSLTHAVLLAVSDLSTSTFEPALALLLEQRVLLRSDAGLRVAHPSLQASLRAQLAGEHSPERRRVQRHLAACLAEDPDPIMQVCSALHALDAGDAASASKRLLAVCRRVMLGEHAALRTLAPLLERALSLLQACGAPRDAEVPVLAVLAVAGYQVDRSYAARYGDAALQALQQLLCFDLARRARRFVGGVCALALALARTALGLYWRRSELHTLEALKWLVAVPGYLMGPAALCVDGPRLRRYAAGLEPLLALGPNHGVALVHRFCLGLAASTEDCSARARALQQHVIDRLQKPKPVAGLTAWNCKNLLGAALYADGIRESLACDPATLQTAQLLEGFSPMHAMQADHLRALYFSHLGQFDEAASFEQRVELQAIALGTAWQAELLAPRHQMRTVGWTHDLTGNRRAARALAALAREVPSFAGCEQRARAADLVLRGKYAEARPLLETPEEPMQNAGWIFSRSLLAQVQRASGEPAAAKATCLAALTHLSDEDRSFVISNLAIEIELALAEAALDDVPQAERRLDSLIETHASKGALILGGLHRARAQVALAAGQLDSAEQHIAVTERLYRSTRLPNLVLLCAALRRELAHAQHPGQTGQDAVWSEEASLRQRLESLVRADGDAAERMRAALQLAMEAAQADSGFIVYPDAPERTLWLGRAPDAGAVAWACARAAADDAEHTLAELAAAQWIDPNTHSFDAVHYRLLALRAGSREHDAPLALVVGAETASPAPFPVSILRVLSAHLTCLEPVTAAGRVGRSSQRVT